MVSMVISVESMSITSSLKSASRRSLGARRISFGASQRAPISAAGAHCADETRKR
jgi:hypothetical protein